MLYTTPDCELVDSYFSCECMNVTSILIDCLFQTETSEIINDNQVTKKAPTGW